MNEVRIDKWLWAARFYKTRSLAQQMVEGGKVHVDGQRVKASKPVRVGQLVVLRQGELQREVEVLALAEKRGSAPQARSEERRVGQEGRSRRTPPRAKTDGSGRPRRRRGGKGEARWAGSLGSG